MLQLYLKIKTKIMNDFYFLVADLDRIKDKSHLNIN